MNRVSQKKPQRPPAPTLRLWVPLVDNKSLTSEDRMHGSTSFQALFGFRPSLKCRTCSAVLLTAMRTRKFRRMPGRSPVRREQEIGNPTRNRNTPSDSGYCFVYPMGRARESLHRFLWLWHPGRDALDTGSCRTRLVNLSPAAAFPMSPKLGTQSSCLYRPRGRGNFLKHVDLAPMSFMLHVRGRSEMV